MASESKPGAAARNWICMGPGATVRASGILQSAGNDCPRPWLAKHLADCCYLRFASSSQSVDHFDYLHVRRDLGSRLPARSESVRIGPNACSDDVVYRLHVASVDARPPARRLGLFRLNPRRISADAFTGTCDFVLCVLNNGLL